MTTSHPRLKPSFVFIGLCVVVLVATTFVARWLGVEWIAAAFAGGGVTLAVGLIVFALWYVPGRDVGAIEAAPRYDKERQEKRAELQLASRNGVAQAIGGVLLIGTLALTAYQANGARRAANEANEMASENLKIANANLEVATEGLKNATQAQLSERFARAVDQLGATSKNTDGKDVAAVEVRLGALTALGRISKDSREYGEHVLHTVQTYLKENLSSLGKRPYPMGVTACSRSRQVRRKNPRAEVRVGLLYVLPALGNITQTHTTRFSPSLQYANFRGLNIGPLNLMGLDITGSTFRNANISGARFRAVKAHNVIFQDACLQGANFVDRSSQFGALDLRGADLRRAHVPEEFLFKNARIDCRTLTRPITIDKKNHANGLGWCAHLIFTSSHDGDEDVYAADPDVYASDPGGPRVAPLTRNRLADEQIVVAGGGRALAVVRNSNVVLISGEGRRERSLGPGDKPMFSPDGQALTFIRESDRATNSRIFVVTVRRGVPQALGPGRPLAFSPHSRLLAFCKPGGVVGLVDVVSVRRWILPRSRSNSCEGFVGWSPNSSRVAFVHRVEDEQGNQTETLFVAIARHTTKSPTAIVHGNWIDAHWLKDEQLGFLRRDDEAIDIGVIGSTGGKPLVLERGDIAAPAWSPRGDYVTYLRRTNDGALDLQRAATNGEVVSTLDHGSEFDVAWSPGGQRLAFARPDGPYRALKVVSANHAQPRLVARSRTLEIESWSPDDRRLAVKTKGGIAVASFKSWRLRRIWTGETTKAGDVIWVRGRLRRNPTTKSR